MIKVGLVGTHGVYKTTHAYGIVYGLKLRGVHAELLAEVARDSPAPVNESASEDAQRWILYSQMLRELEYCLRNPPLVLVTDRASIDNYAYLVRVVGHRVPSLDAIIQEHVASYDYLFRVPLVAGSDLVTDGFRSTNKDFQVEMDSRIKGLLGDFNVPYRDFVSVDAVCDEVYSLVRQKI